MRRRIIIILFIIVIAISVVKIYQTFATSSTIVETDNVYDITLTDTSTVNIPAKTSKIVYYQLCNTNKGKVQYGVGYTTDNEEIVVKSYWDSIDPASGIIDYGENKFIKIKISNHSTEDADVILSTVLGYENGGDLISSSNVTLIDKQVNKYNYLGTILQGDLTETNIETITFTNNNIVPEGVIASYNATSSGTEEIMLWYTDNDNNELYEVYIGSDNGITSITSGNSLFSGYTSLISLDLSNFDTSNVTDMENMFYGCTSLTSLDVSSFDTSKVKNMKLMFYQCKSLTSLDLSNFDTSNVESMHCMFGNCSKLTEINVSSFDTSNVINMGFLFANDSSLNYLNLSSFDTSNVTDMMQAFINISCTIDLRNADFSNVTSYSNMFNGVPVDTTIYVKDETQKAWLTEKFTSMTGIVAIN